MAELPMIDSDIKTQVALTFGGEQVVSFSKAYAVKSPLGIELKANGDIQLSSAQNDSRGAVTLSFGQNSSDLYSDGEVGVREISIHTGFAQILGDNSKFCSITESNMTWGNEINETFGNITRLNCSGYDPLTLKVGARHILMQDLKITGNTSGDLDVQASIEYDVEERKEAIVKVGFRLGF